MKTKLATKPGKRDLNRLMLGSLMFNTAAPMNREQRRQANRHNQKVGAGDTAPEGHRKSCGAGRGFMRPVPHERRVVPRRIFGEREMMEQKHELQQLMDNLRERDANMLSDINGFYGGGMTIENRIALADARATDALTALCVVARYVIALEQKVGAGGTAPEGHNV